MDEPIQLPIDGVLDLHTFKPREIKDLMLDYLAACQGRGIFEVRIIHGKGIGNLSPWTIRNTEAGVRPSFPCANSRLGRKRPSALTPLAHFPRLAAPSEPVLPSSTARPSGPPLSQLCTRPSREPRRCLAVVPCF
jgi:hypothetical protein